MTDEVLEGVPPTRMELLKLKTKLKRAEKGHRLLKEKRDSLVMEFMNIAKESYDTVESTQNQIKKAHQMLALSSAVAGFSQVESTANASGTDVDVDLEYKNIMGIRLPRISLGDVQRPADGRGYSLLATHPSISEAAKQFEKTLEDIVELSVAENSLSLLSEETKRTKRRVNALEYKVIPKLSNTQKMIRMRLEEVDREGFYSRKMIKRKTGR